MDSLIWRVIGIWMIIKAVSLDNITKIVSVDKRLELYKDPSTLMLRSKGDEEEPAKKNEKEQSMRLEENQAMCYPGSQKEKKNCFKEKRNDQLLIVQVG